MRKVLYCLFNVLMVQMLGGKMNVGNLSIKLKIAKYLVRDLLGLGGKRLTNNIRLTRLYCRLGDYHNAINHAEKIYESGLKPEYYYFLKNLYILTDDTCKLEAMTLSSDMGKSKDIIRALDNINDSVYNLDKIKFIKDYVSSKGATPILVGLLGKGVGLKNKTKVEKELLSNIDLYNSERPKWSRENNAPDYIKSIYRNYENVRFDELFSFRPPVIKATKVVLGDMENSYVLVEKGIRKTMNQPEDFNHRVLCFGTSTTYSVGTSNDDTIVSLIQKEINKYCDGVRVENHGVHGMNLLLAINNLLQTEIKKGDVVLFFDYDEFNHINDEVIFKLDLNKYDRGDDFFVDISKRHCHFSPNGNRILAKSITEEILIYHIGKSIDTNAVPCPKIYQVLDNLKYFLYRKTAQALETCEMKSYLSLLEQYTPDNGLKVGSVAVNCNPITNGHLHLLEYASRNVDKLFIFVIEEDKSFFKFEDRLHLVSESTQHLKNVTVLRGGKFICTELTYPDYFDKDTTEAQTDASMEAWFFCEYIAKTLNISKIFLGEEPNCMITRQYNDKMAELLPTYGIDVKIIKRISANGDSISASKVRKLLKKRDFDAIKAIVPEPTYLFLKQNY